MVLGVPELLLLQPDSASGIPTYVGERPFSIDNYR
jgi:hypothetical protein